MQSVHLTKQHHCLAIGGFSLCKLLPPTVFGYSHVASRNGVLVPFYRLGVRQTVRLRSLMVCEKCETKLSKVIVPDKVR